MREHYDFNEMQGKKNPYTKQLKQPITMRKPIDCMIASVAIEHAHVRLPQRKRSIVCSCRRGDLANSMVGTSSVDGSTESLRRNRRVSLWLDLCACALQIKRVEYDAPLRGRRLTRALAA